MRAARAATHDSMDAVRRRTIEWTYRAATHDLMDIWNGLADAGYRDTLRRAEARFRGGRPRRRHRNPPFDPAVGAGETGQSARLPARQGPDADRPPAVRWRGGRRGFGAIDQRSHPA